MRAELQQGVRTSPQSFFETFHAGDFDSDSYWNTNRGAVVVAVVVVAVYFAADDAVVAACDYCNFLADAADTVLGAVAVAAAVVVDFERLHSNKVWMLVWKHRMHHIDC